MAGTDGPEETGKTGPDKAFPQTVGEGDLDRRRRQLEAALAGRQERRAADRRASSSNAAGYAVALRLSSEFIAGTLGGALIGWLVDRFAGTSPWGLIVFLLLGFCAGVLSVMRSAGLAAERRIEKADRKDGEAGR